MEGVCECCGDLRLVEKLITCSKQTYCGGDKEEEEEYSWYCEECKKREVAMSQQRNYVEATPSKKQEIAKVKFLSSGQVMNIYKEHGSATTSSKKVRGRPKKNIPGRFICSSPSNSDLFREITCSGENQNANKLPLPYYTTYIAWMGSLKVQDRTMGTKEVELIAYCANQIPLKLRNTISNFPDNLELNFFPRLNAWPKKFDLKKPTFKDIGFYLFPQSDNQRVRTKYLHLLRFMDLEKVAMKITLKGGLVLLIYSSQVLKPKYISINGELFLWGMIWKSKKSNLIPRPKKKSINRDFPTTPTNRNIEPTASVQTTPIALDRITAVRRNIAEKEVSLDLPDLPPGFGENRDIESGTSDKASVPPVNVATPSESSRRSSERKATFGASFSLLGKDLLMNSLIVSQNLSPTPQDTSPVASCSGDVPSKLARKEIVIKKEINHQEKEASNPCTPVIPKSAVPSGPSRMSFSLEEREDSSSPVPPNSKIITAIEQLETPVSSSLNMEIQVKQEPRSAVVGLGTFSNRRSPFAPGLFASRPETSYQDCKLPSGRRNGDDRSLIPSPVVISSPSPVISKEAPIAEPSRRSCIEEREDGSQHVGIAAREVCQTEPNLQETGTAGQALPEKQLETPVTPVPALVAVKQEPSSPRISFTLKKPQSRLLKRFGAANGDLLFRDSSVPVPENRANQSTANPTRFPPHLRPSSNNDGGGDERGNNVISRGPNSRSPVRTTREAEPSRRSSSKEKPSGVEREDSSSPAFPPPPPPPPSHLAAKHVEIGTGGASGRAQLDTPVVSTPNVPAQARELPEKSSVNEAVQTALTNFLTASSPATPSVPNFVQPNQSFVVRPPEPSRSSHMPLAAPAPFSSLTSQFTPPSYSSQPQPNYLDCKPPVGPRYGDFQQLFNYQYLPNPYFRPPSRPLTGDLQSFSYPYVTPPSYSVQYFRPPFVPTVPTIGDGQFPSPSYRPPFQSVPYGRDFRSPYVPTIGENQVPVISHMPLCQSVPHDRDSSSPFVPTNRDDQLPAPPLIPPSRSVPHERDFSPTFIPTNQEDQVAAQSQVPSSHSVPHHREFSPPFVPTLGDNQFATPSDNHSRLSVPHQRQQPHWSRGKRKNMYNDRRGESSNTRRQSKWSKSPVPSSYDRRSPVRGQNFRSPFRDRRSPARGHDGRRRSRSPIRRHNQRRSPSGGRRSPVDRRNWRRSRSRSPVRYRNRSSSQASSRSISPPASSSPVDSQHRGLSRSKSPAQSRSN